MAKALRTETKASKYFQILNPDGGLAGDRPPDLTEDRLIETYHWMRLVRLLDERMMSLQRQGRIGFYGAITGQEAATVGSALPLRPEDWVFPALREGAVALMRGYSLVEYISQLIGNSRDPAKGHQMPCHHTYRAGRYVAMSSNVGSQLPHAVGVGMAAAYRHDPIVVMTYLGDGATSEGDFHTAMNFAGVFRAPVVFFCQNNQWAISVPVSRQTASADLAIKAGAYGVEGVVVDGNDLLGVYQVVHDAVEKARAGSGPTLIEALTYRMGGHSSSDDPTRYRDQSEVAAWEGRDPLVRLRRFLEGEGYWDVAAEETLRDELQERISQAIAEAESASPPPLETLVEDVYGEIPGCLREQMEAFLGEGERGGDVGEFPL